MPSRNAVKESLPAATYHAYNRGVERRQIFMDGRDYNRFIKQMEQFVAREPRIRLLAYSLMPNHFHLLISQDDQRSMASFIQRLSTGYTMYFNKRHKRVGSLFQGTYKAARIIGAQQLMEVSRYIHLNAERAGLGWRQQSYPSAPSYMNPFRPDPLVTREPVLGLFDRPEDYSVYLSKGEV
jgi:putative transposase